MERKMPKVIPLTQGYVTIVSDEDYKKIKKYKWCVSRAGKKGKQEKYGEPYAVTYKGGKKYERRNSFSFDVSLGGVYSDVSNMTPDLAARQVLMSAYLYRERDTSVLTDAEFDALCIYLVQNWEKVPERYKPLLLSDEKDCTVLLSTAMQCLYTRQVEGGALAWLKEKTGERLAPLGHGYYEPQDNNDISDLI